MQMCFLDDYFCEKHNFWISFCKSSERPLHLTSLVVLTSSAFLLMELMRVLTSERCTSQRTKYSRPSRLSLSFRHGRVSKWWILASNVWNTVITLKCTGSYSKYDKGRMQLWSTVYIMEMCTFSIHTKIFTFVTSEATEKMEYFLWLQKKKCMKLKRKNCTILYNIKRKLN